MLWALLMSMVNVLKFQTLYSMFFGLNFVYYASLKMLSGTANSVKPHQTSPSGAVCLGLHCLHMSFCQSLRCLKF